MEWRNDREGLANREAPGERREISKNPASRVPGPVVIFKADTPEEYLRLIFLPPAGKRRDIYCAGFFASSPASPAGI